TIAFNTADGVDIDGAASTGNAVRGNNVHHNAGLGIHLTSGATAGTTDYPTVQSLTINLIGSTRNSTTVVGSFHSVAGSPFAIDFFANTPVSSGAYEGEVYLGSITVGTDSTGMALFFDTLPRAGTNSQTVYTATVTAI